MRRVWFIVFPFPFVAPDVPVGELTDHANEVEVFVEERSILINVLSQIVAFVGVVIIETIGFGFTVIVTVIGLPEQPFAFGVIVYVIVCVLDEVLVSIWVIVFPDPFAAPIMFELLLTVQANEVPVPAVTLDVNAIFVALPEQIVWDEGEAVATGIG